MKDKNLLIWAGNGVGYVFTAIQTNEVFQIIELCFSVALTILLIVYRIWKWYEEAKKDGKITADEVKEGIDILVDGTEEIKNQIDGKENKDNGGHSQEH